VGERLHHPRTTKGVDGNDRVEQQDGTNPVGRGGRDLETDRSADVMDHEMKPVKPEHVERGRRPAAEPGPRVVEIVRSRSQTQPGQVEGDPAQPTLGEFRQHRTVDERRGRYTVQADDRRRIRRPVLKDKTPYAAGRELPPGGTMSRQHLVNPHRITPPPAPTQDTLGLRQYRRCDSPAGTVIGP
jgi:hypothetical protein